MKAASAKIKPIKIVVWCVLGIILLFVCIVLGSLLVQKYIRKSPAPMFAGYATLVVATGSMNGTINQGDMIIIRKTDDYELGDIVTFLLDGDTTPTTHRLVNYGAEPGTFVTKGDANNTADRTPVREDQILGEVVSVIPKLGLVIDWFLTRDGIISLVSMIAVIIAGVYLWNLLKPEPETDADATQDGAQPPKGHSSGDKNKSR